MAALTDSMGNTINSSIQELRAAMMGPVATSIDNNTSATRSAGTRISNNSAELKKLASAMDGLKQVFQSDFKSTLDALNTAIGNLASSSSSPSSSPSGNDVVNKLEQIYKCLCLEDPAEDEKDRTTTFMKSLKKEFKKEEF